MEIKHTLDFFQDLLMSPREGFPPRTEFCAHGHHIELIGKGWTNLLHKVLIFLRNVQTGESKPTWSSAEARSVGTQRTP